MENFSKMSDIQKITSNNYNSSNKIEVSSNVQNPDLNIQAHYSNNMKVKRTKRSVNSIPYVTLTNRLVTSKELDSRMKTIDTDIYEGARKEQTKHDFNSGLYFKIFGSVAIATAIIACIRKFKK